MVISLIVDSEGFPFSYETFHGNRADVSTIETILRMVQRKYGKARRIWVFDRGIVSEENRAPIRKRDGQYLVGTPRSQMKRCDAELLKEKAIRKRFLTRLEDALKGLEKTVATGRLKDRPRGIGGWERSRHGIRPSTIFTRSLRATRPRAPGCPGR